jgi:hypothetical protein
MDASEFGQLAWWRWRSRSHFVGHTEFGIYGDSGRPARARSLAMRNGLPVLGSLRVIVLAKERGFITAAKPALEKLRGAGAYVTDELIDRAIALANET